MSGAALGEFSPLLEGLPVEVLPVNKDTLSFLAVATNTGHIETGMVSLCFPC